MIHLSRYIQRAIIDIVDGDGARSEMLGDPGLREKGIYIKGMTGSENRRTGRKLLVPCAGSEAF
jgi:hypothetical protein